MNGLATVASVAGWEFRRHVKPKQQLIGLLTTFALVMAGTFLGRLGGDRSTIDVAVVGADHVAGFPDQIGRYRFVVHDDGALPSLLVALEGREIPAVLVLHDLGQGTLHARQDPSWRADLARELTALVQEERLARSGLDGGQLAAIQAPVRLDIVEAAPRAGRAERVAALIALGLMMAGLFSGLGSVFSSVTGEKQNRIAEQVVSAIPPQTWIDGKIIGLVGVAAVAVLNLIVVGVLYLIAARAVWGIALPLPTSVERPGLLVAALALVLLGFVFWFAFLTAIAAVVDDPHNSNRTQLLFLPLLPLVPAFFAVGDPGATWLRVLGLLPPTSAVVLPARLLVTEVPGWEVGLAAILLLAAIWAMRRVAGKVFSLGMLMYGKEPTWSEVRRWLKEA